MLNDWNDLQVFLAVERGRTAREAADRLKCSHSTILRRLEAFEKRVGARLFDRTPDGFMLTEAGGKILERAQQVESEVLELERLVDGADVRLRGPIRLTVPPPVVQYLLLPALREFKEQYPLIEIELVVTYAFSDLSRRDADIAIRFSETPEDYLVGRRLPPFRDGIYASPEFVNQHWYDGKTDSATWVGWPDRKLFATRVKETPYYKNEISWEMPTMPLQAEAARQGMGMAFLPCILGDQDPSLIRVPGSSVYEGRPAWLLLHPDLRTMERVRVLSRFLAEHILSKAKIYGGEI